MHSVHVLYHTQVREGKMKGWEREGRRGKERKGIKEEGQEEGVGKEKKRGRDRDGVKTEGGILSQLHTCYLCNNLSPMIVGSSCAWHQRSAT